MKIEVQPVETISNIYYFWEQIGSHGKSRKIYVVGDLVEHANEKHYITFPKKGSIAKSEKGTVTLKKGENWLHYIYVRSGFRGGASITLVENQSNIIEKTFSFGNYHSQLGNLGIDDGIIVEVKDTIIAELKRSGRLYGNPNYGLYVGYKDISKEYWGDDAVLIQETNTNPAWQLLSLNRESGS